MSLPGPVFAEWQSVPAVRLGVDANDNPRLGQWVPGSGGQQQPEDHIATRALLDARLNVTNTGTRGSFSVEPRVTLDTYQDEVDEDLEREDAFLTMRGVYRGLRTEGRINAFLVHESMLTSEFAATDFTDAEGGMGDELVATDAGRLVLLDEDRERVTLAPSVEFRLSDRGSISVEANHLDVSYTGPQVVGRSDYRDTGLWLGFNRLTSYRAKVAVRLLVSKFSNELIDSHTDTVGIEAAYEVELSELWSIDTFLGVEQSESNFLDGVTGPISTEDTNVTFGMGLSHRSPTATLTFDIGQTVGPNGNGFISTRDDMRGFYRRQMTQRLQFGVGLRFSHTEALNLQSEQTDYARLDFDFEWALTSQWGLSVGFSSTDQEFSTDVSSGQANVVSFGAVYRGARRPSPTGPR